MFPDLSVHTETVLTYEGEKVLLKLELKKGFGDVGIIITRERSTYLDVLNLALYRFSSFFFLLLQLLVSTDGRKNT